MLDAGVKNGKLLAVIVLIICVLGIAAAFRIPVQMIPDLSVRTISVVTGWAGATPQDIEKEILLIKCHINFQQLFANNYNKN